MSRNITLDENTHITHLNEKSSRKEHFMLLLDVELKKGEFLGIINKNTRSFSVDTYRFINRINLSYWKLLLFNGTKLIFKSVHLFCESPWWNILTLSAIGLSYWASQFTSSVIMAVQRIMILLGFLWFRIPGPHWTMDVV